MPSVIFPSRSRSLLQPQVLKLNFNLWSSWYVSLHSAVLQGPDGDTATAQMVNWGLLFMQGEAP
jgi:hypothetical protein